MLPEIKLSDGRTAKFVRKPKAADASKAVRIAGARGNEIDRNAALLAQIVEIDGQKQVMEDMLNLNLDDFGELNEVLQFGRWEAAPKKAEGEGTEDGGEEENFTQE